MVKLSLHCHNFFVYLFTLLKTAALKISCNFSAKLVYINVLDFLMLFCYIGDQECLPILYTVKF